MQIPKKLWNLHFSEAECLDICWHKCLFVKPLVQPCFILKNSFYSLCETLECAKYFVKLQMWPSFATGIITRLVLFSRENKANSIHLFCRKTGFICHCWTWVLYIVHEDEGPCVCVCKAADAVECTSLHSSCGICKMSNI